MSLDEFTKLKNGEITEDEIITNALVDSGAARDLLLGRSKQTTVVPIECGDSVIYIEIYTRLPKKDIRKNQVFIESLKLGKEPNDDDAARFLQTICVDSEFNADFWLNEDLDPLLPSVVIAAYLKATVDNVEMVRKFR